MWSYSGDPLNSTLDQVRFTIGDTDTEYPLLQDEEIEFLLSECSNNVLKASIRCCEAILAKWAKEVTYKTETESVNLSDRMQSMQALLQALELRERKSRTSFPTIKKAQPIFTIGMNDYASHY